MKFTVLNMVWKMLPDLPSAPLAPASTPVLPCPSPSMPQPHWPSLSSHPRASVHSRCLRHSGPTLANPPQHPSRLCLKVAFPKKLSLPPLLPFPPPTDPLTVFSLGTFHLCFISPTMVWNHLGTCISLYVSLNLCCSIQQLSEAVKHLKHA